MSSKTRRGPIQLIGKADAQVSHSKSRACRSVRDSLKEHSTGQIQFPCRRVAWEESPITIPEVSMLGIQCRLLCDCMPIEGECIGIVEQKAYMTGMFTIPFVCRISACTGRGVPTGVNFKSSTSTWQRCSSIPDLPCNSDKATVSLAIGGSRAVECLAAYSSSHSSSSSSRGRTMQGKAAGVVATEVHRQPLPFQSQPAVCQCIGFQ